LGSSCALLIILYIARIFTQGTGLAPSTAFTDDFQNLEHTITRFVPTLIPVQQLDATTPQNKHAFLTNHTLAHAAIIHLYYPFGTEDPTSYEKCLRAARSIVTVIKHISEVDFDFLDPVIGVSPHICWVFDHPADSCRSLSALLGCCCRYFDPGTGRH
jgi:hypothetical protein